ncbi:MAG TPA: GNAT family N-acetyltransferase [Gemmatimonadales bacterium]
MTHHLTDLALSRRLEGAEGAANAAAVDARARSNPGLGATHVTVNGTRAMFDGPGSFLTQSFGFGVCGDPDPADLDAIEAFFHERGAVPMHEVSPLADPSVLALLAGRGYQVVELTSILWQPLERALHAESPDAHARAKDGGVAVCLALGDDVARWATTAAAGWSDTPGAAEFVSDFAPIAGSAHGTHCFLAEIDGEGAGAGSVAIHDGVALLSGASTVPRFRGRGVQNALLHARLAHARALGCDLAAMGALPGSASQRNAERQGFRIAYTRLKWAMASPPGAPAATDHPAR